ncbi:MAG: tRNA epoxyqueuosine(34) reductase QueG [Betaproteobacteria bacterium]|nr:tRNA epoxyqueuosine(34) reductase QueG [Betaproteobacteria bacterium]
MTGDFQGETRDWSGLAARIKEWGLVLGFGAVGIARADPGEAASRLERWLALGRHGEMSYMARQFPLRADPAALVPGVRSIICARLPYWPGGLSCAQALAVLSDSRLAYVSRYALGRDYHKTMRQRLSRLAARIAEALSEEREGEAFHYRVFSDSAPVLEVEFARQAGIAWRGKHTLSLSREGSWHFLGEIHSNLPLPPDAPASAHCGSCTECIERCPTGAIVAPYQLDARLCISYLTIEHPGAIPEALRPLIGNRIYGCDDCQLHCPWNREKPGIRPSGDPDFAPRHGLDAVTLAALFSWGEARFLECFSGSSIRRIGFERWLRNIAVALGNAPPASETRAALAARRDDASPLVREHVAWALARQEED